MKCRLDTNHFPLTCGAEYNASIAHDGKKVQLCVFPTEEKRLSDGRVTHVYETGVSKAYGTALWTDGNATGRLYVTNPAEDPVEEMLLIVVAIVVFVLWCEQTASVSSYAANTATLNATLGQKKTKSAALTGTYEPLEQLLSPTSVISLVYADVASSLAFTMTFYTYKYGVAIFNDHLINMHPDLSEVLAGTVVGYAWFSAGVVWIVLVFQKKNASLSDALKVHAARAAALVFCRTCFESSVLFVVQTLFPETQLGRFAELIGFFVGLIVPLVAARDACLIYKLGQMYVFVAAAVVALFCTLYSSAALVYPVVHESTAVLSYRNSAWVFSLTLCTQAAFGGMLTAQRKLDLSTSQ